MQRDKSLIEILAAKGIPFVVDPQGRVFQIPAGGEGDDPSGDDPPAGSADDDPPPPDPIAALEAKWEQRFNEQQANHSKTLADINMQYARLEGAYNATVASANAGNKVEAPVITIPTEDDIAKAYEDGDFKLAARLTRQMSEGMAKRESMSIRENDINPLRQTVNDVGLPAMANLTSMAVLDRLDPVAKEFYQKNKQAVDAHFARVPDAGRVDPQAFTGALAYEMGLAALNGGLAKQVEDEVERRIRSGNQPGNLKPGGRNAGGSPDAIDPEKVFGAGAKAALEEAGLDWDSYAVKMGYDNMQDYIQKTGAQ